MFFVFMAVTKTSPVDKLSIDDELLSVSRLIDEFEGYPHPHAARIAVLADAIAQNFELATQDRRSLQQAALLHDIGEMAMDRDYLKIDRTLTEQERTDMQRHPVIGEQEVAKRGVGCAVQLIVRWHHEWWNGAGYPDGLERDSIPLAARILRIADTYAALTDSRPHSVPISASEAKRYIGEWAGIEFDPIVVKVFLTLENLEELKSFGDNE